MATKTSPALPVESGPSLSEADRELEGPHVAAKNRRHPHARADVRSIDRPPATDERVDSNASGSANRSDAHHRAEVVVAVLPRLRPGAEEQSRGDGDAPFSRESDWRTSTRLMSFVDRRRETPSALVVTASADTPTMRARCSCPLESVIQTVIPGASRLPRSGRAVPPVWAEAFVGENRMRMASVSQMCFTRMKYMRQCPRPLGSSGWSFTGASAIRTGWSNGCVNVDSKPCSAVSVIPAEGAVERSERRRSEQTNSRC